MNEDRRAFLTETTGFTERGKNRTDVADKFLRYVKFIGHILSVFSVNSSEFYERVRNGLKDENRAQS